MFHIFHYSNSIHFNSSLNLLTLTFEKLERAQTLKGNVKETMSNLNNLAKSSADAANKIAIAKKPTYVPVKEKIHFIEKDQKPENDEFLMKHKFIAKKLIENNEDEKGENDDHEKNGDNHDTNGNHKDSDKENPPKPLPRKSLSEQGSFELDNAGLPKPKPRFAATGYKVDEIFEISHYYLSC